MRAHVERIRLVLAVAALGLATAIVNGGTIHVPGDYPTIQAAIDAAVDGDKIELADGIYTGDGNRDLDFGAKLITVQSENGPENCIIDCEGTEDDPHRAFYFHSGETDRAQLKGLTILNGYVGVTVPVVASGGPLDTAGYLYTWNIDVDAALSYNFCIYDSYGDGICCAYGVGYYNVFYNDDLVGSGGVFGSVECVDDIGGGVGSATIRVEIFTDNYPSETTWDITTVETGAIGGPIGGAILCDGASPTIKNCHISGNSAENGGAVYCDNSSRPTIKECVISSNEARADGLPNGGGAVYCNNGSDAEIKECEITGNQATYLGGAVYLLSSNATIKQCTISDSSAEFGAGVFCQDSAPTIKNCEFTGNSATSSGAGIFNYEDSSPTIAECTFSENSAGWGGAVYCQDSSPSMTDCEFTGNSATSSGGAMYNYQDSSPTVTECTFSDNSAGYAGAIYNDNSSPTVTECEFTENTANTHGAGMYNYYSNPTVTESGFIENSAGSRGGGMYNYRSSPTVTDCEFRDNSARWNAGMLNHSDSDPTVTNCTFIGNTATYRDAGGLSNWSYCDPIVTNCTFIGNSATTFGGGMVNYTQCYPTVINCTFSGNSAGTVGGGIYNTSNSNPTLANCILWGDVPHEISGPATVTYSDVQGGFGGEGNLDAEPLFVDPASEDYHLSADSPCINTGSNYAPDLPDEDIEGNPRIQHCRVDMGTYESQYPGSFEDCNGNDVDDDCDVYEGASDDYDLNGVPDECEDCDEDGIPDGCEVDCGRGNCADHPLGCGGSEDCNSNCVPDECDIADGTSHDCQPNGIPDECELDCNGNGVADECEDAVTYYVDGSALPGGDGSPENPFDTIQAAIDASPCVPGTEIIVAHDVDGTTYTGAGNRDLDFGGRDLWLHSASGDPSLCIIDCQSNGQGFYFHSGETSDAVVEGFTVTNGYATNGAGAYCYYSSPTFINCTFDNNSAGSRAGGMYNYGSSPTVSGCEFRDNSAPYNAGMLNRSYSHPSVTNCTFIGNRTTWGDGGGMSNWSYCNPIVTNCLFIDNTASAGGGMTNWSACDPVVTNCLFVGNSATQGGGIYNRFTSDSPTITNCTFVNNAASYGRGVYGGSSYIDNCILWNGGTGEIYGSATVTYCDVQGGWTGTGNIDADPLFVDATTGDLHLLPGSPCIDAGDNTAVPGGVTTDLDGNPRFVDDPATADTGNGTPPIVDMGAYEFQP